MTDVTNRDTVKPAGCLCAHEWGDSECPVHPTCAHCGEPATCIGSYEGAAWRTFACDECCGHGCEDGRCEPIQPAQRGGEE